MNWAVGWAPTAGQYDSLEDGASGRWTAVARLGGHRAAAIRAIFSPDGRLVASCSKDGSLRVSDVESKRCVAVCKSTTSKEGLNSFTWFENSVRSDELMTAGSDGSVLWFDLRLTPRKGRGEVHAKAVYEGRHTAACMDVETPRWSSQYFLTCGYDDLVKKWDPRNGSRPVASLKAHSGPVSSVELSADDSVIATAGFDGMARLWDSELQALRTFQVAERVPCVHSTLSANGLYLLCTTPPIAMEKLATPPLASEAKTGAEQLPGSPFVSNAAIFNTYAVHHTLNLVLPPPERKLRDTRPVGQSCCSAFDKRTSSEVAAAIGRVSSGGDQDAAAGSSFSSSALGQVQLPGPMVFGTFWRDKVMVPLSASAEPVPAIKAPQRNISPDDIGSGVHIWDAATGIHIDRFRGDDKTQRGAVTSVAAHPWVDCGVVATTGVDGSTVVWLYEEEGSRR